MINYLLTVGLEGVLHSKTHSRGEQKSWNRFQTNTDFNFFGHRRHAFRQSDTKCVTETAGLWLSPNAGPRLAGFGQNNKIVPRVLRNTGRLRSRQNTPPNTLWVQPKRTPQTDHCPHGWHSLEFGKSQSIHWFSLKIQLNVLFSNSMTKLYRIWSQIRIQLKFYSK